jgi:hypothetical protein
MQISGSLWHEISAKCVEGFVGYRKISFMTLWLKYSILIFSTLFETVEGIH